MMAGGQYEMTPVDLYVGRHYRIYVTVPYGSGEDAVYAATKQYIKNLGLDDTDLDLEVNEIEEEDILNINPDFDGAWLVGKDELQ